MFDVTNKMNKFIIFNIFMNSGSASRYIMKIRLIYIRFIFILFLKAKKGLFSKSGSNFRSLHCAL